MNATNASSVSAGDDDVRRRLMNITLLSIGGATVLMNTFVILLIASFKSMRSNANIIIGSMAVTDLMAGVATIIAGTLKWSDWFYVPRLICQITFTFDVWAANASLAHVLAVNLERYLAIVFPLQYKNIVSVRRLQLALLSIWIISLVVGIALTVSYKLGENCVLAGIIFPRLAFGTLVIADAFPLVTVVGISIHIVVVVVRKLRFMAQSSNLDQAALARSQRKMFGMVSVILAAWIICWLPLVCVLITLSFAESFNIPLDIGQFVTMFYYVEVMSYGNSLLNPFLYFCTSTEFRKAGRTLLFKCKASDVTNEQSSAAATDSTRF
jgi:hypothetical protein